MNAASLLVYRYTRQLLTAIDDLDLLGPRKGGKIKGIALVCGGSISGLLTARVLSDHFENVLIVEPEEWLSQATEAGLWLQQHPFGGRTKHTKVPQYTFMHCYMKIVGRVCMRMFPDFRSELEKYGGRLTSGPYNPHFNGYLTASRPWRENNEDYPYCSRPLLETTIRRLLLKVDIPDAKLPDLQRILNKKRNDHAEKLHSIHEWWLTEPDMDVTNFGFWRMDYNKIYIGYGGYGVKEWPKFIHGFREVALRLRQAKPMAEWVFEIFEFLEKEEFPIKIDTMRLPPCLYINYAAGKILPSNFVVIGDAIHKANPIKSQGVGKAAVHAATLGGILSRCTGPRLPADFATSFFKLQEKRTGNMWSVS
ncbi:hypothetical protein M422DRAFT_275764 [Sphaerobolus stellatus SS14]|uniref:FAD-binding domain-containing protein n=1 Tax=Sphaerobolus stellatus (strain SS14) TaxID=990650 RepID=A0A0C9UDS2_SPHS4|nr:hypothetical protein M422DRAFT_275764 [Sphaerobolus stellatus SS14]